MLAMNNADGTDGGGEGGTDFQFATEGLIIQKICGLDRIRKQSLNLIAEDLNLSHRRQFSSCWVSSFSQRWMVYDYFCDRLPSFCPVLFMVEILLSQLNLQLEILRPFSDDIKLSHSVLINSPAGEISSHVCCSKISLKVSNLKLIFPNTLSAICYLVLQQLIYFVELR